MITPRNCIIKEPSTTLGFFGNTFTDKEFINSNIAIEAPIFPRHVANIPYVQCKHFNKIKCTKRLYEVNSCLNKCGSLLTSIPARIFSTVTSEHVRSLSSSQPSMISHQSTSKPPSTSYP